jgi:hypothetical protein
MLICWKADAIIQLKVRSEVESWLMAAVARRCLGIFPPLRSTASELLFYSPEGVATGV